MTDELKKLRDECAVACGAMSSASPRDKYDIGMIAYGSGFNECHAQMQKKIAEKDAEIEYLQADGVHTCSTQCRRSSCVQRRRIAKLEADLALMIEALKFYSSGNLRNGIDFTTVELMRIQRDNGQKARETLEKLGVK